MKFAFRKEKSSKQVNRDPIIEYPVALVKRKLEKIILPFFAFSFLQDLILSWKMKTNATIEIEIKLKINPGMGFHSVFIFQGVYRSSSLIFLYLKNFS